MCDQAICLGTEVGHISYKVEHYGHRAIQRRRQSGIQYWSLKAFIELTAYMMHYLQLVASQELVFLLIG